MLWSRQPAYIVMVESQMFGIQSQLKSSITQVATVLKNLLSSVLVPHKKLSPPLTLFKVTL